MNTDLTKIALQFKLEGEIECVKPLGEGFINDTFLISTTGTTSNYILQRKNKNIFSPIPAMMDNIEKVCHHIKMKVVANGGNPLREAMTVIRTRDDKLYFLDDEEEYWAVSLFISDTIAYDAANTPELAFSGGKGIGRFQSLVSDLEEPLVNILPGFHDIRFRFDQWNNILAKDPADRKKLLGEEISWIEKRKAEMLEYWKLVENGEIPTRVSHNDTKINNILFDKNGNVLCVIDLDTVLSSTVLNDFGDAMRTYTNTGKEDDENLQNVAMNIQMFEAFTKGYLEETSWFLSEKELEYLAFSARYITFEQVLRFLMDYIDGDNYYKIKSPEHNLIRARAQYKLLQSMETQFAAMQELVKKYAKY